MSYEYVYIKNEEELKNFLPFNSLAYEKNMVEMPTKYPCIVEFEDESSPEVGNCYHIEFIYDMDDFIYNEGILYKKDSRKVISFENETYIECKRQDSY